MQKEKAHNKQGAPRVAKCYRSHVKICWEKIYSGTKIVASYTMHNMHVSWGKLRKCTAYFSFPGRGREGRHDEVLITS